MRLGDRSILSGIQTFRPGRFEGGGMRYLRFTDWLVEIAMRAHGIRRIVFEEVRRHAGIDAAHIYGGFLGTLTAWCEGHEVPYEGVPVGTIKRFATGKGNADKTAMTATMRARGFAPADDTRRTPSPYSCGRRMRREAAHDDIPRWRDRAATPLV